MKSRPSSKWAVITCICAVFACERSQTAVEPESDGVRGADGQRATASAPASSPSPSFATTCEQVRACCVAIGKQPGLEPARPLCQMYWLRDVLREVTPAHPADRPEELCQMEMIQLQNLWNVYSMTDAGAGRAMPKACEWSHPTQGPMPFTPLGPIDGAI